MTEFIIHLGWLTLSLSVVILATLLWSKLFGKRFSARSRYLTWTVVVLSLCIGLLLFRLPALFTLEVPMPILENEVILPTEDLPEQMEHTPSEPESTPIISDEQVYDPIGNTQSPTDTPFVPDDAFPSVEPSTPNISTPTVPTSPSPSNPVTNEPVTQPSVSVTPPTEPTEQHEKTPSIDLPLLLFCIWGIGAVTFFSIALLVYIRSVHKYNRKRELCDKETLAAFHVLCRDHDIGRIPQLYICEGIGSPVLYGYTAPVILIPKLALPKEALVGVLAHELTHYRRRDLWVKLLCVLAEALHWFNPLVHLAAARCNAEMELSCDEEVLAGLSADVRRAYGSTMLEILKHCNTKRSLLTTQFNPHKNAVKERFVNILDMTTKKHGKAVIVTVLMLCLIFGVAIGCTTVRADADGEALEQITDDTLTVTDGNSEEALPPDDSSSLKEFDLLGFMDLNWRSDEIQKDPYLMRSDIMGFDPLAEDMRLDIPAVSPSFDFQYAINGGEQRLFGLPGYMLYAGSATKGELDPSNIVLGTETPLYEEYYIYDGDGKDLKYDYLYFTAYNISLDDYADLMTTLADTVNIDLSSIELLLDSNDGIGKDYENPVRLHELAKRLGIDDTSAVADQTTLDVTVSHKTPIIITKGGCQLEIEIRWSYWEKLLRFWGAVENSVPPCDDPCNQIEIHIYSRPVSKQAADGFDIEGFAALNWRTDKSRKDPYLMRNDIMDFDATAEDLGMVPNMAYPPEYAFSYAINGGEETVFGLDGYVFYHGVSSAEELAPNVVAGTESQLYGEYSCYIGNGDDLKYDSLFFSATNLSFDDYSRCMTAIADLANVDPSSFLLLPGTEDGSSMDWLNPTNLKELGKRLGIRDTREIVKQKTLLVDTHPNYPIIIPIDDEHQLQITVNWRYWEKFVRNYTTFTNYIPMGYDIVNQLDINISMKSADKNPTSSLTHNTSLDALCHELWAKRLSYSAAVLHPVFQDAVVKEFSKHTKQPLTWENLQYSVNTEDNKYQYTFWCQSESSYMIYLQCGVNGTMDPNGNTSFGLDWLEPPYLIFGPYAAGDELCFDSSNLNNERGTYLVNITAMRAELDKKLELPGYQIQEYGIQVIGDDMIYAPLLHNGRCYLAHIRIKPSREYELVGNLLQDFPNGSPYEFFMEHRAFGILPIDLVRNHVPHPLNPEGILSEYLNENGTVKDGVLIGSSFMSTPHITVRVDESDINYYLIHRKSGKVIERDDITRDMRYEDLYWGFRPVTNQDVIAMYEKVFAAEMKIRSPYYRTSVYFGDCQLYEGVVWKSSNRCAYIDFDGDGLLEALVQSGANGENILHYDVKTETVYATYLSASGGYIYFANGEFCHNYEYDLSRYRVHSFVGCVAKLIKIMYTDTEPQNQIPAWFDVEIKPSQS